MKSFVHEASSLETAVQQAWIIAGKPINFNIKLLEEGISTFLWWKKKPYKIAFFYETSSIFKENKYDDKKISSNGNREKHSNLKDSYNQKNERAQAFRKDYKPHDRDYRTQEVNNHFNKNDRIHSNRNIKDDIDEKEKSFNEHSEKKNNGNFNKNSIKNNSTNNFSKNNEIDLEKTIWTNDMLSFSEYWLKHVIKEFNLKIDFPEFKIDQENLILIFSNNLSEKDQKQKYLPTSLSVLLYESLKKNIKDKEKFFRILVQYK